MGAQATLDVTLQRGAALSGQVLYSDGAPAASVTLVLEDTKANSSTTGPAAEQQQLAEEMAQRLFSHQTMSTDDQGHFRLAGLRPGTYRLATTQPTSGSLSATVEGDEAQGMGMLLGMPDVRALRFYAGDTTHRAAAKSFELHAGEEVSGIQITLPTDAFHEVRGTVVAQDGRLVTQGQMSLTDTADPQLIFHAAINNDGSFRISQVPAGSYTLGSANGRIREVIPGGPAGAPERYQPHKTVAAFADASQPVLVQDHDLEGVNLTVTEIPFPKDEARPAVGSPDSDD